MLNSAFQGLNNGTAGLIGELMVNTVFEINTSSLQMDAECIIGIFFE